MQKYNLNIKLITSLSSALFMPSIKILEAVNIAKSTWYEIMKAPTSITIQQLLAIANGLHIPVRRFFSTGETKEIGNRDDYIINYYHLCLYDANALKSVVSNRPDVTWQKAAKATGMSYQNLQKSLLAETRLPVTRLLTVCKVLDIDPFDVIIDPNPLCANKREKKKNVTKSDEYDTVLANITAIQRDIASFKALLEDTKRDIANLSKKLDAVSCDKEVKPIAWRTKRVASEAAKIAKEAQKCLKEDKQQAVNGE